MFGFGRKQDLFDVLYGKGAPRPEPVRPAPAAEPAVPVVTLNALPAAPSRSAWWHGEKYPGGIGPAQLLEVDYWTLRARSVELFSTNLYARGLIRRLVTNEINTGLHLEAKPEESVLDYEKDGLADWAETIENRFRLWAKSPLLCDHMQRNSFGVLQASIRRTALVAGDVLIVLQQDKVTGLPSIRLVSGASVQTPLDYPRKGNRIEHGVELDAKGRHVAYWIVQDDGTFKRLPAWGKAGRRQAWLVYGTDKLLDDVRGQPALSIVLQSLKEIDRYRDSVQRKAVINSMLAMFVKKDLPTVGTRPITGGAVRRGTDTVVDSTNTERTFNVSELIPGLVLDELQPGEEPHGFLNQGTDEKFGDFEAVIVHAFAWANNVPPEIMTLGFSNNYSASQAAINEFKLYLNVVRSEFGEQVCHPIYVELLLAEALARKIDAPGLLSAWRDPTLYDAFAAWTSSEWSGHIKPAVDFSKLVKGYKLAIDEGLITRDRAARELTGTKYSKNAPQLRRENEALAEAREPLGPPEPSTQQGGAEVDPDDVDREDDDDTSKAVLLRQIK